MLRALVGGATDAVALAELARGRMRKKIPQLEQALSGHFAAHQQFLVAQQLVHIEGLEALIERVSQEIAVRLEAEQEAIEVLQTIPGVGQRIAEIVVAEVGTDLTRFQSAAHLGTSAGLCPGQNERAGKRRSSKTRKGSPWLRVALVEAAQAAGRTKETYLAAQYHRLAARRGAKRAAVAVAHTILVIVYYLLTRHEAYQELGMTYFDERDRQQVERRLVHRLEALGYLVALQPAVSVT